eukprot:scaffold63700_cov27-Tisochrysis_lutea.AAC.4
MAKSIRSKVKKRLRSVKRSVIKKQKLDPSSKLGEGGARAAEKLKEAVTGYIKPSEQERGGTGRGGGREKEGEFVATGEREGKLDLSGDEC